MGRALTAAAVNNQTVTAALLNRLSADCAINVANLWKTIKACIGMQNTELLSRLLKWVRAMSDSCADAQQRRDLRLYAIETGAVELLQTTNNLWALS
jgi:hypothetical protein